MKKAVSVVIVLCLLACMLTGCANEEERGEQAEATKQFTDSVGRTVTVPEKISKIAISGPLSQVYILPLAGDMLVGVSNSFSRDAELYLPAQIMELPEIGQLYGGKGEMDLEALLAADPDVVIDIGEAKQGVVEDMDALSKQTGIPFVHIDATTETSAEAYRILGDLLSRQNEAEELASWCEDTLAMMNSVMERVDADGCRKSILYCLGDKGTNVMAEGSFHADTINKMGRNVASVEEVSFSGDGNESDIEQIMTWDPDVIIFSPESIFNTVGTLEQWKNVSAIAEGHYYETPYGPYGWLSSPPAVQRYLGMLWLGAVLYPNHIEYDLKEKVTEYYKLFYGCELTDTMYRDLVN